MEKLILILIFIFALEGYSQSHQGSGGGTDGEENTTKPTDIVDVGCDEYKLKKAELFKIIKGHRPGEKQWSHPVDKKLTEVYKLFDEELFKKFFLGLKSTTEEELIRKCGEDAIKEIRTEFSWLFTPEVESILNDIDFELNKNAPQYCGEDYQKFRAYYRYYRIWSEPILKKLKKKQNPNKKTNSQKREIEMPFDEYKG